MNKLISIHSLKFEDVIFTPYDGGIVIDPKLLTEDDKLKIKMFGFDKFKVTTLQELVHDPELRYYTFILLDQDKHNLLNKHREVYDVSKSK